MSHQETPHHLSPQEQRNAIAYQTLDAFSGSLQAFSSALRLQFDNLQRLQKMLDSPTDEHEKVEQAVQSLLVQSLIRK